MTMTTEWTGEQYGAVYALAKLLPIPYFHVYGINYP